MLILKYQTFDYKFYHNQLFLDQIQNQNEIHFWNFIQYEFFTQWSKLKKYANDNGIKIIGDIAIYVAYDSSDVWERPENYRLNKKLDPIEVAGCPPDAFTEDGQLWGNPIYNWKYMKNEGYSFWVERMKKANTPSGSYKYAGNGNIRKPKKGVFGKV